MSKAETYWSPYKLTPRTHYLAGHHQGCEVPGLLSHLWQECCLDRNSEDHSLKRGDLLSALCPVLTGSILVAIGLSRK